MGIDPRDQIKNLLNPLPKRISEVGESIKTLEDGIIYLDELVQIYETDFAEGRGLQSRQAILRIKSNREHLELSLNEKRKELDDLQNQKHLMDRKKRWGY